MKKLFTLALACSLFAAGANAQVEDANYAVSMNLGNVLLNGSILGTSSTISGKYLLSDQLALTAGIGISNSQETDFDYDELWDDRRKVVGETREFDNNFEFNVGVLYSFRPGERIQPFVGANLSYGIYNSGTIEEAEEHYNGDDYYSKSTTPYNTLGAAGQFGVEYFFAKNISISAAFDLGISSATYKTVKELDYDEIDKDYEERSNYTAKTGKGFGFYTGQTVALNIYF